MFVYDDLILGLQLDYVICFNGILTLEGYLMPNPVNKEVHTHTHTYIHLYIYIYIYDF